MPACQGAFFQAYPALARQICIILRMFSNQIPDFKNNDAAR
jgi:hypothetical protein